MKFESPRLVGGQEPEFSYSWWTFQIFFVFLLGEGEGGVLGAGRGRGVGFLLQIQGGLQDGGRGSGRVCGELGNFLGGGG